MKDKVGVCAIWSFYSEREFRSNLFWLQNVSGDLDSL